VRDLSGSREKTGRKRAKNPVWVERPSSSSKRSNRKKVVLDKEAQLRGGLLWGLEGGNLGKQQVSGESAKVKTLSKLVAE